MGVEIVGQVGPQVLTDGNKALPRLDRSAAQIVKEVTGRFAEAAHRDELFLCSTPAAGVTVPIYSNVTQQFVLFNPLASKFKYEVLKAWAGYVSGTHVAGHLCWAYQANAQATEITGTAGLAVGARLSGIPKALKVFTAATVVAFTYLRPWNYSQAVATAASAITPWQAQDDTEGSIVIEPGQAVAIAANVAAFSVSTLAVLVRELAVAG